MSWLAEAATRPSDLEGVFGLTPEAFARFRELYASLWDPAALDPSILELCRLRVAALLGSEGEARVRFVAATENELDETKVRALAHYPSSPLFSDLERRCLAYVEQYVLDPRGLEDRDFVALGEHLSEPQIVALTMAAAVFDALTRFRLALGVASSPDGHAAAAPIVQPRANLAVADRSGKAREA
jgi:alkylhydroperoxidase family enzyme